MRRVVGGGVMMHQNRDYHTFYLDNNYEYYN